MNAFQAEDRVRSDFDEIARLSECCGSEGDRYQEFLAGLIPRDAHTVLDVGCGLGRLAARLAAPGRAVTGVDLSPEMIARARRQSSGEGTLTFLCGDFLAMDLGEESFDCVISAGVLHHMSAEVALAKVAALLRPGGTLVIHDLRSGSGFWDHTSLAFAALAGCLLRFMRTGRPLEPRALRQAWARHGAGETYLTMNQVRVLANRLGPGAEVYRHWFWRYTIMCPEVETREFFSETRPASRRTSLSLPERFRGA